MENWNIRLLEARKEKKLTLRSVSEIINITQQSLIEYEKGNVFPKLDVFLSLCECYSVKPNFIIYGNNMGLNLDTDLKRIMETLVPLLIYDKIDMDENNHIIIKDHELLQYFSYFYNFYKNYDIKDVKMLEKLIDGLKRL